MTNEEAIKIIKGRNFRCVECIDRSEECCEALDMAIQSLEYTDCDLINRDALLEKMWSDFYKLQEEHEKEQGYEYIGTKRCLEQNGFECALKTVINFPKSEQTDGDLISRKEAEKCCLDGWNKDYKDILEDIRKLPSSEKTAEWIPVSERLPEDGRPVLIYAWNVHHVIARYDEFRTANGYKKCWVTADAWNGNTEINHEVIAWMPLPEPYKAE